MTEFDIFISVLDRDRHGKYDGGEEADGGESGGLGSLGLANR